MMNKKASGDEDKGPILTIILAVLIFIIVGGVFASFMTSGPGSWFKSILPDFNKNVSVVGVEKIRYDALTDNVQYFNGKNKWVDFPQSSGVSLNGKILTYNQIHDVLNNYYFKSPRTSDRVDLDQQYNLDFDLVLNSADDDKNIHPSFVQIFILEGNTPKGAIYLSSETGNLIYPSYSPNFFFINGFGPSIDSSKNKNVILAILSAHPNFEKTIKSSASNWLVSIKSTPVTIEYSIKRNDDSIESKSEKVCVEPAALRYIVINLAQEVYGNECL